MKSEQKDPAVFGPPMSDAAFNVQLNAWLAHANSECQIHVAIPTWALRRILWDLRAEAEEVERLEKLIHTPEILDFIKAVQTEAVHQRERWPSEHDEGKEASDWFWLLGYLAGKALHAEKMMDFTSDDPDPGSVKANKIHREKMLHHIITTAAACCNWHAQVLGKCKMRPGIDDPPK
jgi:hypothetical protein